MARTFQFSRLSPSGQKQPIERSQLIHAYAGSGNELARAKRLADELLRSRPNSGYAQTLAAEAMSTWRLDQSGRPTELRDQIVALCDEALKLNPTLAQAHVAKGRALLRASMYGPANVSIDAALAIDPGLAGAIFLRAEIFRRTGHVEAAEQWYRRFIGATPSRGRKSNGYYWIGKTYQDAADVDTANRASYVAQARKAYEQMLAVEPDGAWRNVNFAIFLNEYAADFVGAERYAQIALEMMEFPMARYHLAAARYQKLWADPTVTPGEVLNDAVRQVATTTGVSLAQAISFPSFSSSLRNRLQELRARVSSPSSIQ